MRVQLRKFPYPYLCAIALSNDAEFMTPKAFWDIHRFLNTTETTALGPGLGLQVTDSIFMYSVEPSRSFSYFEGISTRPSPRAGWLRDLMQIGCVDVLHAFGDFDGVGGFTRAHAASALDELHRHEIGLQVWTNHGTAENTQNIGGSGATYQRGDVPNSAEYHADLTTGFGLRFLWLDFNATNQVGQDAQLTRRARVMVALGREKGPESLLADETLRDGSRVNLFKRYRGPNRPDPATLAEQLSPQNVDRVLEQEAVMIVYQHLGCDRSGGSCRPNQPPYFQGDALTTLQRLAERHHEGDVWVTGVASLLRYRSLFDRLDWSTDSDEEGSVRILVRSDEPDLAGLTFVTPDPSRTRLFRDQQGGLVELGVQRNPPDHRGRPSVSVPLEGWELPATPRERYLNV